MEVRPTQSGAAAARGSITGWYDAIYLDDGNCFPGRTQYVMYPDRRSR